MKLNNILIIGIIFFLSANQKIEGQLYFELESSPDNKTKVLNNSKEEYLFPWVGGMNSCQFGEIDLNLDGIKDLFVFDRMGDRIMTFLNGGMPNTLDYNFAPQYISSFPELFDWVILKDYNNDGLEDIFTYAKDYPGLIVYKNVSLTELAFELEVSPFLTSLQGSMHVNILTTDVDYPGIDDVDNDGDLDILTFWGLGSFVEYHQNQSMELYGIPDSLEYVEVTQCWGFFAENDESNVIYLDTCMGYSYQGFSSSNSNFLGGSRHTGSTFLLLDLDGDADKDLLLGDVDYPNPIQLINGGTPDSAHMISQDPEFPSYNKPVNLFSMPAAAYLDVDNDGLKDLLMSPFDPSLVTSANHRSVWFYSNTGANDHPEFNFIQNNLIQEDMIDVGSGAYPVFADYNGDGLQDLFVSNFGYYMYSYYEPGMFLKSVYWSNIALFQNTGSQDEPHFTHVTHDFAGLHEKHFTGIYPTFGDIDNDMDSDMIIGKENGTLVYFENTAGSGEEMNFADPIFNFGNIDVGDFSTPQLFDLDQDGLIDLIIGEKNGNLNYYKNTGTPAIAQYELLTDSLGKINVTNFNLSYTGYSTPFLFENMEDQIELIVGSEQGKVFYYKDFEDNLDGEFVENDSLFVLVDDDQFDFESGIRTGAAMAELNGDEYFELIVGNYSGGLHFYKGTEQASVSGTPEGTENRREVLIYPNPAVNELYIKTNEDLSGTFIHILNLYGQEVLRVTYDGGNLYKINVSDLNSGLYLIQLQEDSKLFYSERFLKL